MTHAEMVAYVAHVEGLLGIVAPDALDYLRAIAAPHNVPKYPTYPNIVAALVDSIRREEGRNGALSAAALGLTAPGSRGARRTFKECQAAMHAAPVAAPSVMAPAISPAFHKACAAQGIDAGAAWSAAPEATRAEWRKLDPAPAPVLPSLPTAPVMPSLPSVNAALGTLTVPPVVAKPPRVRRSAVATPPATPGAAPVLPAANPVDAKVAALEAQIAALRSSVAVAAPATVVPSGVSGNWGLAKGRALRAIREGKPVAPSDAATLAAKGITLDALRASIAAPVAQPAGLAAPALVAQPVTPPVAAPAPVMAQPAPVASIAPAMDMDGAILNAIVALNNAGNPRPTYAAIIAEVRRATGAAPAMNRVKTVVQTLGIAA